MAHLVRGIERPVILTARPASTAAHWRRVERHRFQPRYHQAFEADVEGLVRLLLTTTLSFLRLLLAEAEKQWPPCSCRDASSPCRVKGGKPRRSRPFSGGCASSATERNILLIL